MKEAFGEALVALPGAAGVLLVPGMDGCALACRSYCVVLASRSGGVTVGYAPDSKSDVLWHGRRAVE